MSLADKIQANTEAVLAGKYNVASAIVGKGGTVNTAGNVVTFNELADGVNSIETSVIVEETLEINGATDMEITATGDLFKGDVCVVTEPIIGGNDLELLGTFTMSKSGMLPFIMDNGNIIAHPYDDGNGYFYFYKLNDNGTYTQISLVDTAGATAKTWWGDNCSRIYDRVTKRIITKEKSGKNRIYQIAEDNSKVTVLRDGTEIFGGRSDGVYFANADNIFLTRTNADIGVYRYHPDTNTVSKVSSMFANTGLSFSTVCLVDAFINGAELYTVCVYNTSNILVQKFILNNGSYVSDGTYKQYTNVGISYTHNITSFSSATFQSPLKFNKSGEYIFKYDVNNLKVTASKFNKETLEITGEVDIITNVGAMVTVGNYIFVQKNTTEVDTKLFEMYELNEDTGVVSFVCYPIETLDENIHTLPYINNIGTQYDSFWFPGLNALVYNKFGIDAPLYDTPFAQNCYNSIHSNTETTKVIGYGVVTTAISDGEKGVIKRILSN